MRSLTTTDITTIENKLILPENEVVAVVHQDIARAIYAARTIKDLKFGEHVQFDGYVPDTHDLYRACMRAERHVKVGQTYVGIFGTIGEVELGSEYTSANLIGMVHIPRQLLPFVEIFVDDMKGFYKEFFGQVQGGDWRGGIWNIKQAESSIDAPDLEELSFVSKRGYYWKLEKAKSDIFEDGRPLEEQVTDYETAVKGFIKRLDAYVAQFQPNCQDITHETAKAHYDNLQRGDVRLLARS